MDIESRIEGLERRVRVLELLYEIEEDKKIEFRRRLAEFGLKVEEKRKWFQERANKKVE